MPESDFPSAFGETPLTSNPIPGSPDDYIGIPYPIPEVVASPDSLWSIWFDGEEYEATYEEWVSIGVIDPGLTWSQIGDGFDTWVTNFDDYLNPAPKGGSGRSRAPYQRPDERLVRSAVSGAWAELTGGGTQQQIDAAVQQFFVDDRADYDNVGQQIDAMAGVLETIRKTDDYKAIHQLRTEGTDERTWISSKVGRLLQAGVSERLAQELGVAQAQAGAGAHTVERAGEIATLTSTGRMLDGHKARLRDTLGGAIGLL
jgi:hypothetical protein